MCGVSKVLVTGARGLLGQAITRAAEARGLEVVPCGRAELDVTADRAVRDVLARKRPDAKDEIDENLDSLKADLFALDERLSKAGRSDPNRPLLASHPVYQYLARRYGLNLRSLHWEPDQAPTEQASFDRS